MWPFGGLLTAVIYQAIGGGFYGEELFPADAAVTLRYDADGGVRTTVTLVGPDATNDQTPWSSLHPSEIGGSGWHVRVTFTSGNNQYDSGSGLGTWLVLSANRDWRFERSGPPGTSEGTYLVEISNDGGSSVYDSAILVIDLLVDYPM
jgi:hypothetical protein